MDPRDLQRNPTDDDIDADEADTDTYWEAQEAIEDQWRAAEQNNEGDEEEDDDMDFEPDEEDDEEEEDDEFEDAEGQIEVELEITGDGTTDATGAAAATRRVTVVGGHWLAQLLENSDDGPATLRRILEASRGQAQHADSDDDEDEEYQFGFRGYGRRRPKGPGEAAYQKVPSDEGRQLMETGMFGSNERREDTFRRKKRLAAQIMRRELGLGSNGRQKNADRLISQSLIPRTKADMIIHYNARCYSGQFSNDGNFFFSCAQDFRVRMYDTSNPYDWKYYKTVEYPYGQWTITDASLSSDNRWLAYSSIRSTVCLSSTDPADDSQPHLLDFTNSARNTGGRHRAPSYPYFGIWSLRFSGDGREIVAGTGDSSVYVYDIETNQSILRIAGHTDDVNAVCYGDPNSPHILYSGSDDTTIKVWDRRSLGDGREAGIFLGHTEGLTYVDSKGDGRYVLSNSKDQTAKLWDLRKMMTKERFDEDNIRPERYTTGFEYRNARYDPSYYTPHPHDSSLVTFRGHDVLKTLIRCHFSPAGSTDGRYVYTGSHDGKVYVYNLDATLAGTIDVLDATRNSRPRDPSLQREAYDFIGRNGANWQTCVRDASWHPSAPVIAATSWNGWGTCLGTCSVHSWNDGLMDEGDDIPVEGNRSGVRRRPGEARRLNARLEEDPRFWRTEEPPRQRSALSRWLS